MVSVSAGFATDVGLVRQDNEDSVLVSEPVFAVADGMGGYAGGATASAIAVEHLRRLSSSAPITSDDVYRALTEANDEILRRGTEDPATLGMGTTVAGLALVQNGGSEYWLVFNVGDSRVYRYVADHLAQVSVDHSYTQELIDEGRITAEEALTHPERNVVTRALGSEPDVAPDMWLMAPEDDETFLLCSDGLTRELSVAQMEDLLRAQPDPQAACDDLVTAAVQAGGRDNVSVVLVHVGSAPAPDEATTPPSALRAAGPVEEEMGRRTSDDDDVEPGSSDEPIVESVPGRPAGAAPAEAVIAEVISDVPNIDGSAPQTGTGEGPEMIQGVPGA